MKSYERRLRWLFALAIALVGGGAMLLSTPGASAATKPVTVTITRIIEVEDPDPTQGDGDYYAKVQIDGCATQQGPEQSGEDFEPFWTFSCNVDTAFTLINVRIEIWGCRCLPGRAGR